MSSDNSNSHLCEYKQQIDRLGKIMDRRIEEERQILAQEYKKFVINLQKYLKKNSTPEGFKSEYLDKFLRTHTSSKCVQYIRIIAVTESFGNYGNILCTML